MQVGEYCWTKSRHSDRKYLCRVTSNQRSKVILLVLNPEHHAKPFPISRDWYEYAFEAVTNADLLAHRLQGGAL